MAQIKRKKVNSKATKGQKKDSLLKNKKFWIIFSSIAAALIIIGVTIGLIVYFNSSDDENTVQDYFAGEATNLSYDYNDEKVSFTKMSYDGVLMHHEVNDGGDDTFVKYIFVFATNLSTFYADRAIDDGKSKDDDDVTFLYDKDANKVFNQLVKLQGSINEHNKNVSEDERVALYIVDTSIGDNTSIFADSENFGGSDDSTNSVLFALLTEDGFVKDFKNNDKETVSLTTNTLADVAMSMVNNAMIFMNDYNFISVED